MALIVQNDAGTVANANGYISNAYFKTHLADRAIDNEWSDADIDAAIVVATEFIDMRWSYRGALTTTDQTTQFPRTLFVGLPANLKKATAELALRQLRLRDEDKSIFPDPVGDQVKRKKEKVGPIEEETEYELAPSTKFADFAIVEALLKSFTTSAFSLRVERA